MTYRGTLLAKLLVTVAGLALGTGSLAQPFDWRGIDLQDQRCTIHGHESYGPFDYTDPRSRRKVGDKIPLKVVEDYHFTDDIRRLIKGRTGKLPSDILYVLSVFPNHHQALWSLMEWHFKIAKRGKKGGRYFPVECWLDRAIAYSPNDAVPPMIYGIYLHRRKMLEKALEKYELSIKLNPNYSEAHYNYGLALFALKKYEQAREQARKAASLGYPLKGLQSKLKRAGYPVN